MKQYRKRFGHDLRASVANRNAFKQLFVASPKYKALWRKIKIQDKHTITNTTHHCELQYCSPGHDSPFLTALQHKNRLKTVWSACPRSFTHFYAHSLPNSSTYLLPANLHATKCCASLPPPLSLSNGAGIRFNGKPEQLHIQRGWCQTNDASTSLEQLLLSLADRQEQTVLQQHRAPLHFGTNK